MLKTYLKKILEINKKGDAREESYYSTLENLLKNYLDSIGKKKIDIRTLPKKTEAGNPDFKIWDGKQYITGYIEAKAPTKKNLDRIEATDQLKRYLHTFPNLILTNFFEFRLYRNGSLIDKALIEEESNFLKLLKKFFSYSFPKVYNAKTLALELATRTRFLRDEVIAEELEEEEGGGGGFIIGFFDAFRKYLISGLSKEEFADLYSQTITFGLFAARTRTKNEFNRKLAYDSIPHTIGILREVFQFISLGDLPKQMEWIIDDIAEVLAVTDVKKILHDYFHEGKGKDPIFHFYETFLAEYDPKKRKKCGVYYTPEPVISYIVCSLHHILKGYFNRPDGLANDSVTVLDPAAGTLTFLANAAKLAVKEFVSKYGEGGKENFIKEHVLKNFYAFELMMAPYAVGHLKMFFLLEELGYRLQGDDRFKLYLTNTLEMEELAQTELPGMASLSEESHLAGNIKKEQPILVILGNPPYSGISANKGDWITELIENYKYVDGKHFGEKKHMLQDDYVKFIRFAQWKLDQTSEGILGFICNHSFLDNITFRGMRQSLMNSFNEIYILDLHGNSLKKEKCPDGSKDENVFDIQQGVAIVLFIKKKGDKKKGKVNHLENWGSREDKYDWLLKNDILTSKWREISPKSPYYFFIPTKEKNREIYEKHWKVSEIFPIFSTGIETARDSFVIDFDKDSLKTRIKTFRNNCVTDEFVKKELRLKENYMWRVSTARKELMAINNWEEYFTKIHYRPFDVRHIYLHDSVVWRTRKDIMRHMLLDNLGLITSRQVIKKFRHAFVSNNIINRNIIDTAARFGNGVIFPLYLYPDTDKRDLFSHIKETQKKQLNISPKILTALHEVYKKEPSPVEIFYYIYSILYSNIYRTKYAEFLKIDFPRIPFTKDYRIFHKMAEYGKRLIDLHLLKSKELDLPFIKFQGKGDNKVEKLRYEDKEKRVYFNKSQYFEGITKELWHYQIGGYQVCEKWLKDRKGKNLSLRDLKHYCKFATSIKKTIETQKDLDTQYPKIEEKIIEFEAD